MDKKKVIVIPAKKKPQTGEEAIVIRRVAAYARVSTDSEEQLTSYKTQVKYYTEYIQSRPDWEFVDVYTDEGISGTTTAKREGFKKMIQDALDGKIDLIITKSVSRFARNTVDSLQTVRDLKEKGVEVYFEKENIWTMDAKGELVITIMASLAQEESRSISENVKWGVRKAFADGKTHVGYNAFLGYDAGFVINEEEAETVRMIYRLYLNGLSANKIVEKLEKEGRLTAKGCSSWTPSSVMSVLTNEKYMGDALLQKTFVTDFLTHKRADNTGELQQYYVENHHEPIIDRATFFQAQKILRERQENPVFCVNKSPFTHKVQCGECGGYYGHRIWHSSHSSYRRELWHCNNKYTYNHKHRVHHLSTPDLQNIFLKAINIFIGDKENTISDLKILRMLATQNDDITEYISEIDSELEMIDTEMNKLINDTPVKEHVLFADRYKALSLQYEALAERKHELEEELRNSRGTPEIIDGTIKLLNEIEGPVTEFSEELWHDFIDHITLFETRAQVTFKGGKKVNVEI